MKEIKEIKEIIEVTFRYHIKYSTTEARKDAVEAACEGVFERFGASRHGYYSAKRKGMGRKISKGLRTLGEAENK